MAIKTTIRSIVQAQVGLGALLGASLPAKASYAVSKLAKACQSEMEDYNLARAKIFEEAGCVEKDGKFQHEVPEKLEAAVNEADELLDAEVSLNALPLDLEQFGRADVPGHAFINLEWAMKALAGA